MSKLSLIDERNLLGLGPAGADERVGCCGGDGVRAGVETAGGGREEREEMDRREESVGRIDAGAGAGVATASPGTAGGVAMKPTPRPGIWMSTKAGSTNP